MIIGKTAEEVAAQATSEMEIWKDGTDGEYVAVNDESELPHEEDAQGWQFIGYVEDIV